MNLVELQNLSRCSTIFNSREIRCSTIFNSREIRNVFFPWFNFVMAKVDGQTREQLFTSLIFAAAHCNYQGAVMLLNRKANVGMSDLTGYREQGKRRQVSQSSYGATAGAEADKIADAQSGGQAGAIELWSAPEVR
ncbi:hypothetical protein AK812_SmicGene43551 [Symbiodinium microadriaticum]|uniref:Uncharacterized protein n=1 Tax=Symbiodinium microadriaticum TaxID=2951 RepID=A0A1Q9C0R1_SYMMI|nr:hypothetical protein AK812_SmicGene43551 [Symbiodinium microadriaticum]